MAKFGEKVEKTKIRALGLRADTGPAFLPKYSDTAQPVQAEARRYGDLGQTTSKWLFPDGDTW